MKVVFLDFDGVLNNQAHLARAKARRDDPPDEREQAYLDRLPEGYSKTYYLAHFRDLDTEKVDLLNLIVRNSKSIKVVISSSWRIIWTTEEIQALLEGHGFEGKIVGMTPKNVHTFPSWEGRKIKRGHEIQAWLDANPSVKTFVTIDDSTVQWLRDRQVRTTFTEGLTFAHVKRARRLLTQ